MQYVNMLLRKSSLMLQQVGHTTATLVDRLLQQLMYNRLKHSQSYQICTGGSSAILRGSPQPPPPKKKFRDSTSIRPRPLPAISFDNTPFMKRPIIRRYIVLVTGTVINNPQKRLTDTWTVVTCIQIGGGTQQNNAGIRKYLYTSLFCEYSFSVHYTQ